MPSSRGIDGGEQGGHAKPRPSASGAGAGEGLQAPGGRERDQGELSGELARIEDRYKRALADLDNYRKRSGREVERRVADARESMLSEWLEVVDSVERAMQLDPTGPCRDGLEAVMAQIDAVLKRQGAQRIGSAGEPFDPGRHEAVAVRTAEPVPDYTVLEVQRAGYALDGRVIRPAQVVVARASEPAV